MRENKVIKINNSGNKTIIARERNVQIEQCMCLWEEDSRCKVGNKTKIAMA